MLLTLRVKKLQAKKTKLRITPCVLCSRPVPTSIIIQHEGDLLCRVCYSGKTKVEHRVCNTCMKDFPLSTTYYYKKTRGDGYMRMCRYCRDARLRRRGQRICGGCWRIGGMESFTLDQWGKSFQDMALCYRCDAAGRGKCIPKMNERICPRCNTSKLRSAFHQGENRISPYCKVCTTEYNRERYVRVLQCRNPDDIDRTPRTLKFLYAMQSNFGEQELVDSWAEGVVPKVDDTITIPLESRSKGDTVEFKTFMTGFEKALSRGRNVNSRQGAKDKTQIEGDHDSD